MNIDIAIAFVAGFGSAIVVALFLARFVKKPNKSEIVQGVQGCQGCQGCQNGFSSKHDNQDDRLCKGCGKVPAGIGLSFVCHGDSSELQNTMFDGFCRECAIAIEATKTFAQKVEK